MHMHCTIDPLEEQSRGSEFFNARSTHSRQFQLYRYVSKNVDDTKVFAVFVNLRPVNSDLTRSEE
jgi:hypothetical protein